MNPEGGSNDPEVGAMNPALSVAYAPRRAVFTPGEHPPVTPAISLIQSHLAGSPLIPPAPLC
jgi:hypothetical protein